MSLLQKELSRKALTLSLLGVLLQQAWAADSQVVSTLVDQGKYWQSRSRSDLAAESWQKLLRIDAGQPDALYGLAMSELDKNNTEAARSWLAKLKAVQPKGVLMQRLEDAIAARSSQRAPVDSTRKLSSGNQTDEALLRMRQNFGDKEPAGEAALEYYQLLAGTPKGWDEARKGLERLVKESSNDARISLALAQHLSYRERTRIEAIARLALLSKRSDVGAAAEKSWRQSLVWLNARPADQALYANYLESHADDSALRSKLKQLQIRPVEISPQDKRIGLNLEQGFSALKEGELEPAALNFEAALKDKPDEANALGGLGVIRLRQQRFSDAAALLERASKFGKPEQWRSALNSASYWAQLQKADTARQANDLPAAQKFIEQAVHIDNKEVTGQIALAEVRGEQKQYDAAEKILRDVLAREPQQSAALTAYADLLVKQYKYDDALQVLARLTPQQRVQMGGMAKLEGDNLRKQASLLASRNDLVGARTTLENALAIDPASVWVRLDLGRIYMQLLQANEARSVTEGLLLEGPDQPDALFAAAMLQAENQDWRSSQQALEQIPAAARKPAMNVLYQRAQLHLQIDQAVSLSRQGQNQQAGAMLRQIEQASERNEEQMATLASAYAEIGDAGRALGLMRQLLSKSGKDNSGLQLQYAAVLLNTRQDAEFSAVMRQLQNKALNQQESISYGKLRTAFLLRQADVTRESGDLAAAYDVLTPLLAERPDDTRVLSALARMYSSGNDPAQALQLYKRALSGTPNDLDLLMPALTAATDARSFNEAQSLAERASYLEPESARVLIGWARLYRAQGKNTRAEEFYRAALAAEARSRNGLALGEAGAEANPFRRNAANGDARLNMSAPTTGNPFGTATRSLPPGYLPALNAPAAAAYLPAATAYMPAISANANQPARHNTEVLPLLANEGKPALPYYSRVLPSADTGRSNDRSYDRNNISIMERSNERKAPVVTQAESLRLEAAAFAQERSANVNGQFTLRSRAGEAGLGKLTEVQSSLEARLPLGDGKAIVKITPIALDGGQLAADYNSASRFGSGPVAARANTSTTDSGVKAQSATGVGLAVGYEGSNWKGDIGSTPLGFPVINAVGGLQYKTALSEQAKVAIGISRRAVTESLLSFAGAHDDRTNQTWGGVTSNGVRAELGWDAPGYGLYAHIQANSLLGQNVVSNSSAGSGAGVYVSAIKEANRELTLGLNTNMLGFSKNLSGMTIGNGGYFSPQSFFSLNLPLKLTGTEGKLGYALQTSVGVQYFRQDEADYFPGNPGLQAAAASAAAAAHSLNANNSSRATYADISKTALAYNLGGAMEYQLSPQLTLGAAMAVENGNAFQQLHGNVYMRFALDAMNTPKVTPPQVPRAPFAGVN